MRITPVLLLLGGAILGIACTPSGRDDTANGGLANTSWTVATISGAPSLPDARPTMTFDSGRGIEREWRVQPVLDHVPNRRQLDLDRPDRIHAHGVRGRSGRAGDGLPQRPARRHDMAARRRREPGPERRRGHRGRTAGRARRRLATRGRPTSPARTGPSSTWAGPPTSRTSFPRCISGRTGWSPGSPGAISSAARTR